MAYSHGIKWTDELIETYILRVVDCKGLKHFPTHSEMNSFYGSSRLSAKVSESGGTRFWAEKLGLPIKDCESELGNDYELYAIDDIKHNLGLEAYQTKPRYPYDLLVNNSIKIDVKVSYPYQDKGHAYANTFNLEKREPTCDIFIMYCLDFDGNIAKTLIIPAIALFGKTQLAVGKKSKWDTYKDKWSYISEYDLFMSKYKAI